MRNSSFIITALTAACNFKNGIERFGATLHFLLRTLCLWTGPNVIYANISKTFVEETRSFLISSVIIGALFGALFFRYLINLSNLNAKHFYTSNLDSLLNKFSHMFSPFIKNCYSTIIKQLDISIVTKFGIEFQLIFAYSAFWTKLSRFANHWRGKNFCCFCEFHFQLKQIFC